jgi:hypothetical protein
MGKKLSAEVRADQGDIQAGVEQISGSGQSGRTTTEHNGVESFSHTFHLLFNLTRRKAANSRSGGSALLTKESAPTANARRPASGRPLSTIM